MRFILVSPYYLCVAVCLGLLPAHLHIVSWKHIESFWEIQSDPLDELVYLAIKSDSDSAFEKQDFYM